MSQPSEDIRNKINVLLEEAYASRVNNLSKSIQLAIEARDLSLDLPDNLLTGKSLNQLALFYMILGEYKKSISHSKEAIKYCKEFNDEKGVADAKYNIAGVYYKTDNFHLGLVYLIDCLKIYQKYEDYHNQARTQKSLGTIYEYFGDQKRAIKYYETALESARKAGDLNLESNVYNPLSGIYLKQDKIGLAIEAVNRAMEMKRQTGDTRGYAFALYSRGKVRTKTGDFEGAKADFLEALQIHDEMGERLGMGMTYHKIGVLYVTMGELDPAIEILEKAVVFSNKYNMSLIKFKSNHLLYKIYKQKNDEGNSLKYLEKYLEQKEKVINTQTLKVIESYEIVTRMESLEKEAQMQREKAEIIEKKNRAEHASRVRQEFLSTMSHEIRTPLNAVITITSLLEGKANKEEHQLIESLKFSANNLLLIVNDILDFTKLDSGKVQLDLRAGNFKSLLENIKNTYNGLAKEKGLKLTLKVDPSLAGSYELDDTKMSQILGNLISNAIKFTEAGNVFIKVDKAGHQGDMDQVRFTIEDTGVGIPKESQEEIFESFSQPKSISTRKQGGSGLGLAIVKKLVELHNSHITVISEVGKGSVFSFDLFLKKSNPPIVVPTSRSNQLEGKMILLAEDNPINAMVAKKLLSTWGINTVHAKNGIEAVEKSDSMVFDYILMDIHMPEMNGFDASRAIRLSKNLNALTPIFALTADITAEQEEEYHPYFTSFLLKPIEKEKLYQALIGSLSLKDKV